MEHMSLVKYIQKQKELQTNVNFCLVVYYYW